MNQSKLMNLPDKPLSKFEGALVIDMTILIFESKKEVGHSKHRNKKIIENIIFWFLKKANGSRKRHYYISKSRWDVHILKSVLATV